MPKIRAKRPKCDATTIDALCALIVDGNTLQDACAMINLTKNACTAWRNKGKRNPGTMYGEFDQRIVQAEALAIQNKVNIIKEAAKTKWAAAAWWLERRYPEVWGQKSVIKQEITGRDGGPIQTSAESKVYNMDELKEIIVLEQQMDERKKGKPRRLDIGEGILQIEESPRTKDADDDNDNDNKGESVSYDQ